jgi:DNA modification methylase
MVDVFREVRRVLRKDGTLWLNLGDSYVATQGGRQHAIGELPKGDRAGKSSFARPKPAVDGQPASWTTRAVQGKTVPPASSGLKPKDLVGIPWRVAFALQADGWYLRSDIIWAKPNPMPESVTDRPTKAHEYLFLLTKSARYYYDAESVRDRVTGGTHGGAWNEGGWKQASLGQQKGGRLGNEPEDGGRNLRSVWTIATAPYPGAHFATFPPKLVEPCVKAGCPPDGTVLDPFGGSGTTGMVAQSLGRLAVLIDLNGEYLVQAMARNAQTPLGLVG